MVGACDVGGIRAAGQNHDGELLKAGDPGGSGRTPSLRLAGAAALAGAPPLCWSAAALAGAPLQRGLPQPTVAGIVPALPVGWLTISDRDRLGQQRLRALIDAGRSVVAERELEAVFDRLLRVARDTTGARYAALGVLNESRDQLADFITLGIDEETRRAITYRAGAACSGS